MIITAGVARNIADPNLNKNKDFPKKQVRQLRRIESAIIRASKKRKTFIEYFNDPLYECVQEVLEKNGYKVINRSTYEYTLYVIYWRDKK